MYKRQGYAHATGLPDAFADVVVCSQSFHWMEPESTLQEIGRILDVYKRQVPG